MRAQLDRIDLAIGLWMESWGHLLHRIGLGVIFTWFGVLKQFGHETATSLLAHTIYWGSPLVMVRALGVWEIAIGLSLLYRPLNRLALLLLAIRIPGTLLAFVLQFDVCFRGSILVPTPEGQYLIKDIALFAAALVIGGTLRPERAKRIRH